MSIAAIRTPWAALFIFLAAQLGFLVPRTVFAHEGSHQTEHADADTGGSHTAGATFTTPCPGGSGHSCGCGNLDLLARDNGSPLAAISSSPPGARIPRSGPIRSHSESLFAAACILSRAWPRAPPLFA